MSLLRVEIEVEVEVEAEASAEEEAVRRAVAGAAPAPREGARLPPPQTERGQELPARVAPTVGAVRRRVVARRL